MVKYKTSGEDNKIIHPIGFNMMASLEDRTAITIPAGTVRIGDILYGSINEVPEELRKLIDEVLDGNTTKSIS